MKIEDLKKQVRIEKINSKEVQFDRRAFPAILIFVVLFIVGAGLFFYLKATNKEKYYLENVKILSTIFPFSDITREIVGENEEVEFVQLIPSDANPLSYTPSDDDIRKLNEVDIVYKVGLGYDDWVDEHIDTESTRVVDLSEFVEVKEIADENISIDNLCKENGSKWLEEYNECLGLEKEACEKNNGKYNSCASSCRHETNVEGCIQVCVELCRFDDESISTEKNPYYWLSVENSKIIASVIYNEIITKEPKLTYILIENYNNYMQRLDATKSLVNTKVLNSEKSGYVFLGNNYDYLIDDAELPNAVSIEVNSKTKKAEITKQVKKINQDEIKTVYKDSHLENNEVEEYLREVGFEVLTLYSVGVSDEEVIFLDLLINNISTITDDFS